MRSFFQLKILKYVALFFGLAVVAAFQKKPPTKWLEVVAKKGDTPEKWLRLYDLNEADCNREQFFKLNKMGEKERLKTGETYFLPIKIVKYNGKSIRTTLLINDLTRALRIKTFNENAKKDGLRDDDFVESRNLWVPFSELNCEADDPEIEAASKVELPEKQSKKKGKRVYPIFGEAFEKVPLEDQKMSGKIFYIVSGHGGIDAGAVAKLGKNTLCEDEYAYDVALRLTRKLLAHGATPYLITRDDDDGIRETDICKCDFDEKVYGGLRIPASQKPRLFQRSDLINALFEKNKKAGLTDQTLVEIHVDSRSKRTSTDVFFYHKIGDDEGLKLAEHVHKTFMLNYLKKRNKQFRGTVSGRDLHMLRESKPLGLYVELGNIRNAADQQRILRPENREALANWLFEGLSTFKK